MGLERHHRIRLRCPHKHTPHVQLLCCRSPDCCRRHERWLRRRVRLCVSRQRSTRGGRGSWRSTRTAPRWALHAGFAIILYADARSTLMVQRHFKGTAPFLPVQLTASCLILQQYKILFDGEYQKTANTLSYTDRSAFLSRHLLPNTDGGWVGRRSFGSNILFSSLL